MHDIDDEGSCSGTQTCSSQGECLQDGDKTNDIPDQFFKLGQSGYEYYPAVAQSWIVRVPGHLVEMRLAVACTGEPSFRIGIERLDDASRLSGVRVAQIDTANVPQTGTVKFEGLRLDAPLRMQTGEKFAVVIERNANRGACKVGYTKKNPSEGWLLVQQESDGGGPEWTTQFGALNFQILVKP
jgi:hypothetical protein